MRAFQWGVMNGMMWAGAYWGLYLGQEWAKNILMFLVWVSAVTSTLASFNSKVKEELQSRGPCVPRPVAIVADIVLMIVLAGYGRFFSAVAMLFSISAESSIFKSTEDK